MEDREIFAAMERMMRDEKLYLDSGLTIETAADRLGVHRNSLSRAVNHYAGMGFPLWLGSFRVEEAGRLAAEGGKPRVEELAMRAGFASRASFYRTFRKINGTAPSGLFRNTPESNEENNEKPFKNKH